MNIFATNDQVDQWEAQLPHLLGRDRVDLLVVLCWHLRQRDTERAIDIADEVLSLLEQSALTANDMHAIKTRLTLVRAEANWLFARVPGSEDMARGALKEFRQLGDWRGCADAHWLLGWLAVDAGKLAESDLEFEAMSGYGIRVGDPLRAGVADAALSRSAVLRNPRIVAERWGQGDIVASRDHPPALAAWSSEFLGTLCHCTGDFGRALSHTIHAYQCAVETGQIRAAIIAATNIAEDFNRLRDHQAALEWMQKALDSAKSTRWPQSLGACLLHMAETLRYLKNLNSAQEMLTEALGLLGPVTQSRLYSIALQYQGDLALDRREFDLALEAFCQLEKKAGELDQIDFYIDSQRGQAHCLNWLNQPQRALVCAFAALACAEEQGDGSRQIEILLVITEIFARHSAIDPPQIADGSAPLHYLHQAMGIARTISGYTIPSTVFEQMSREYAAIGDFAQAYAMAREAVEAKEKTHGQETTNRAVTMQVFHQTERARMEGEYHRQLAAAELKRSEDLLNARKILEQLNAIGREITTHLEANEIFQVLDRYVHSLLDVSTFAIYLIENDGKELAAAYCTENGERILVGGVDVADPAANSARCVRERRELICDLSVDGHVTHVQGTLRNLTGLYAPLAIGDRLLGVLSVQSVRRNAFAERELLIFRSLCAYAAIGLDNAQTYRTLKDTQQQLVYQEKMAALGSLVAGVAHELNTPIGNGMVLSSGLCEKTDAIVRDFRENKIRRSALGAYFDDCQLASGLIFRSFQCAADLVQSFKQVAVDQTTAQRRVFDLKQLLHDIVATMSNQLGDAAIACELDIVEGITMDSYPGPLGQVIMNFINNSLVHAFEGGGPGQVTLMGQPNDADRVRISFSDNGAGISPENLAKVFDPFFTTKLGQGGSGLGLSVCYNLVKSILDGNISVVSELQRGTTFMLDLPLVAAKRNQS